MKQLKSLFKGILTIILYLLLNGLVFCLEALFMAYYSINLGNGLMLVILLFNLAYCYFFTFKLIK